MTNEEQLKIYAAYLPYELKGRIIYDAIDDSYNEDCKLCISDGSNNECNINSWLNGSYPVKPYLYPLDYLTKEIEHEGKIIIPIVELAKIGTREGNCYITNSNFGTCYVDAEYQKKGFFMYHANGYFIWQVGKHAEPLIVWSQYKLFQNLLEWHFNIFNLPEDQYINKATLKTT